MMRTFIQSVEVDLVDNEDGDSSQLHYKMLYLS